MDKPKDYEENTQEAAEDIKGKLGPLPFAEETKSLMESKIYTEEYINHYKKAFNIIEQTQKELQSEIRKTIESTYSNARMFASFQKLFAGIRQLTEQLLDSPSGRLYREITGELEPYIEAELKKPKYNGASIADLFDNAERDENGYPLEDSLLMQAIVAAMIEAGRNHEQTALPAVQYKTSPQIELTLDKLSQKLFDGLTIPEYQAKRGEIPGQLSFIPVPLSYERKGKEEITLMIQDITFNEDLLTAAGLSSVLDDEDYFILSFIADAKKRGNDLISATALYRDSFGADPNETQLREFIKKLEKLATTTVKLNDREIREAWGEKKNGTYKEIVQQLAPIAIGSERFTVNGQPVEAAIKIYDYPAVFQAGQITGQITTVKKSLLNAKKNGRTVKHTKRYYRVLHFLIYRISRIKDGKLKNKILYSTFYEKTGEKTARAQQLAKELLFVMLDHFKNEGWITGYKEETTESTGEIGIKITWKDDPKKNKKRALPRETPKE